MSKGLNKRIAHLESISPPKQDAPLWVIKASESPEVVRQLRQATLGDAEALKAVQELFGEDAKEILHQYASLREDVLNFDDC